MLPSKSLVYIPGVRHKADTTMHKLSLSGAWVKKSIRITSQKVLDCNPLLLLFCVRQMLRELLVFRA